MRVLRQNSQVAVEQLNNVLKPTIKLPKANWSRVTEGSSLRDTPLTLHVIKISIMMISILIPIVC